MKHTPQIKTRADALLHGQCAQYSLAYGICRLPICIRIGVAQRFSRERSVIRHICSLLHYMLVDIQSSCNSGTLLATRADNLHAALPGEQCDRPPPRLHAHIRTAMRAHVSQLCGFQREYGSADQQCCPQRRTNHCDRVQHPRDDLPRGWSGRRFGIFAGNIGTIGGPLFISQRIHERRWWLAHQ